MNKQKTYTIIMIILIILSFSRVIYAEENQIANNTNNTNTANTTNATNSTNETGNNVRTLTLQEQKNQVQEQLTTATGQLTYVQGELSSKLVNIQQMQDKINEYQTQVNNVNKQYQEIQAQVQKVEEELQKIQREYNRKDRMLRARLVEMYKRGTTTYLDVLLGSKDFGDFLSNYFIIETIAKYDSKSLDDIKTQKQKIEKLTNELNEKKTNMRNTKNEAEKQAVILANTKTILESEKASLDESEKQITAQIDSYKKQQEEINNLINSSIIASTYELQYSGGIMIWPTLTTSYITSPFGSRLHPIQGVTRVHDGIDIGGDTGDPIYAASNGVIIYYGWMSGYGNTVMVDHGTNAQGIKIVTLYGHGSEYIPGLGIGSAVKKGQEIMKVGSTGNSTGPHVHFEVMENGTPVDPKGYLSSTN